MGRDNRDLVRKRANNRCEAMIKVNGVWTRCFRLGIEVHHMLTRARGGAQLDAMGEIYHLIALCPQHHRAADGEEAYQGGLLIDGYMVNGKYQGTDKYLRSKYGEHGEADRGGEEGPADHGEAREVVVEEPQHQVVPGSTGVR